MKRWLVFGLTGQVGEALREQLVPGEAMVLAVSRQWPATHDDVHWLEATLEAMPALPGPFDVVLSLGPLDAFSRWYAAHGPAAARVIALGSTSVHSKSESPDAAERQLATTLAESEARLDLACAARGSVLTLLRPTLIYGNGRDHSLSRMVALARRWRWLPLPGQVGGLRQPVHVDDVAAVVLQAARAEPPVSGRFDLPGGETLPFDEMLTRTLRVAAPGARLLRLPGPVFRLALALARLSGRGEVVDPGILARMGRDQVYDTGPAREALSHQPRGFQPSAGMFPD